MNAKLLPCRKELKECKTVECGDLSPLCPPGRPVGQAEPRPAAREDSTCHAIQRRQVAYPKRRQVSALQSLLPFPFSPLLLFLVFTQLSTFNSQPLQAATFTTRALITEADTSFDGQETW